MLQWQEPRQTRQLSKNEWFVCFKKIYQTDGVAFTWGDLLLLKIRPEQWRSLVDDNFSRRVVESLREDAEPFCIGLTDIDLRKLVDHALAIGRDIYVTTERELAKLALINLVSRGQFIETEDFKNHIQSFGVADTEKVDRVLDAVIEALEGQS